MMVEVPALILKNSEPGDDTKGSGETRQRGFLSVDNKHRFVRVSFQTKDFRGEGILEVPAGGYRGRVLDYLNSGADFIALTDVLLVERGEDTSSEAVTHDVLLLRRSAIEFVIPLS